MLAIELGNDKIIIVGRKPITHKCNENIFAFQTDQGWHYYLDEEEFCHTYLNTEKEIMKISTVCSICGRHFLKIV